MGNWRCTWCGKGTTKKQLEATGKCGGCTKLFERFSYQQTLDRLPESVEEGVRNAILDKATLALAAGEMKKQYPLKHPLREWDQVLLILVDERRRNRVATVNPGSRVRRATRVGRS